MVHWEANTMVPDFVDFLLEAKRSTYAAKGDDASVEPMLPGSKQLEYRRAEFTYRDIYFGMRRFVGQETVYIAERPIWSMAYGGGIERLPATAEEVRSIYAFLREALRLVPADRPFRGPVNYCRAPYAYSSGSTGDLEMFRGAEEISGQEGVVYRLRYSGGRVDA
jgi:hypothetical protein